MCRRLAAALTFGALGALGWSGCTASRPHVLEYVVLPDAGEEDEVRRPPPEAPRRKAAAEAERRWPIYGDEAAPAAAAGGTGGAGCSVGLIGAECERGLLEDEVPLSERPAATRRR